MTIGVLPLRKGEKTPPRRNGGTPFKKGRIKTAFVFDSSPRIGEVRRGRDWFLPPLAPPVSGGE